MLSLSILINLLSVFFNNQLQDDTTVAVYFFLRPDCPISQQYTPIINNFFQKEHGGNRIKKIELIFNLDNKENSEQQVLDFLKKYNIQAPYRIDRNNKIAKKFHATVTPEVFVFVNGIVKYHGAIDNMYAKLGVKRIETSEFYLQNVLDAIRNNSELPYTFNNPLGCLIEY